MNVWNDIVSNTILEVATPFSSVSGIDIILNYSSKKMKVPK